MMIQTLTSDDLAKLLFAVWLVMIYIYILIKNEFSFLSFYMITFNNLLKNIKKTKQINSINSVAESKKC